MSDENVGGWKLVSVEPSQFQIQSIQAQTGCDEATARLFWSKLLYWASEPPAALSAHGQPEPNGKLVGWWNGISRHDDRDGTGPSVRWGEGAENTYHDIPLYDGYNPIHYVTPPAHGQPVVDDLMIRRFVDAVNPMLHSLPPPSVIRAALTAALKGVTP